VLVSGLILAASVALEAWGFFRLLAQNGRLLVRLEALEERLGLPAAPAPSGHPIGTPAPAFSLPDGSGHTVTLASLLAEGRPVLLLFIDPDCAPCSELLPDVKQWQSGQEGRLTTALISRGSPEANSGEMGELGLTRVLLQEDREVAQAYLSTVTPSAVAVRPDGTIATPLSQGTEAIRALAAQLTALHRAAGEYMAGTTRQ
jgi:peroxiredoxin